MINLRYVALSLALAVLGGAAGALLLVTNRRVLTSGVMIVLALIPAFSLAAMALLDADLSLAVRALARWSVDAVLVLVMSMLVFALHRQRARRFLLE